MNMVGYILGLGDRHLSNLMLDKLTGEVMVYIPLELHRPLFERQQNRFAKQNKTKQNLSRAFLVSSQLTCLLHSLWRTVCPGPAHRFRRLFRICDPPRQIPRDGAFPSNANARHRNGCFRGRGHLPVHMRGSHGSAAFAPRLGVGDARSVLA